MGTCSKLVHSVPFPAASATPFPDMGNFSHEAMATDPATGITYLTEDGPSAPGDVGSGFYRFLYNVPGHAEDGGRLQMLAIKGILSSIFRRRGARVEPSRCGGSRSKTPIRTSPRETCRRSSRVTQAEEQTSGVWKAAGTATPASSSYRRTEARPSLRPMEPTGEGQLFEYNPKTETLRIRFVSPARSALENPDNIVVAPDGSVIFCEDNSEGNTGAGANEGSG